MRSNSDLANLFDSTSIATLFLDQDLRIRRFTPRLLEIFNLREGDEGRPISDIVTHLTRDGLGHDVQQVLRDPGADRARGHGGRGRRQLPDAGPAIP